MVQGSFPDLWYRQEKRVAQSGGKKQFKPASTQEHLFCCHAECGRRNKTHSSTAFLTLTTRFCCQKWRGSKNFCSYVSMRATFSNHRKKLPLTSVVSAQARVFSTVRDITFTIYILEAVVPEIWPSYYIIWGMYWEQDVHHHSFHC